MLASVAKAPHVHAKGKSPRTFKRPLWTRREKSVLLGLLMCVDLLERKSARVRICKCAMEAENNFRVWIMEATSYGFAYGWGSPKKTGSELAAGLSEVDRDVKASCMAPIPVGALSTVK